MKMELLKFLINNDNITGQVINSIIFTNYYTSYIVNNNNI